MKRPFIKKQLSPDAPEGGGETPNEKPGVPAADLDFLNVAELVGTKWTATAFITLAWKTAPQYNTLVSDYRNALTGRRSAGAMRPGQTATLAQLDDLIDDAVTEVKLYIDKKFKKANGKAQYPRYGIVKEASTYRLPADRNSRKAALPMMVTAIADDGFDTEEYGSAFWAQMVTDYNAALSAAGITDSTVSGGVSNKNQLKKEIKKVMTALRFVLRGNYPETYAAEYRVWGWQKEDY